MNAGQQNQSPGTDLPRSSNGIGAGNNNVMPADKVMEHLWRYFALHAQQRISVFNFFVVLSGVIAAAIGGALQAGRPLNLVVVILGLLLPLISFVFWRLDQRNSDLVKISERALRQGEEACLPDYARIFIRESLAGTSAALAEDRVTQTRWTFRTSFRLIFLVMAIAGILASGFAVHRWFFEPVESKKAETSSKADAASGEPPASPIGSTPLTEPSHKIEPVQAKEPGETKKPATKPELAPNTEPAR